MPPTRDARETPALSWILPLYRTRAQLDELILRVAAACRALEVPCEVLLVDDACPEGCAAHLAARGLPAGMRLLRLPVNRGQDGALVAGLREAAGEWAVLLDADLQDPPEAVLDLWARRGTSVDDTVVDAVFARRRGRYEPAGRLLTSYLYRGLASWLGGLPRGAGLFVLLHRRVIDRVVAGSDAAPSLLAAIAGAGRRFVSVPIERAARPGGASAYTGLMRLARALRSLVRMAGVRGRRRRLPVPSDPVPSR